MAQSDQTGRQAHQTDGMIRLDTQTRQMAQSDQTGRQSNQTDGIVRLHRQHYLMPHSHLDLHPAVK